MNEEIKNAAPEHIDVVGPIEVVEPTSDTKELRGHVSDCKLLNVRKKPIKNAEVVSVIPVGTELIVESVMRNWYKVTTVSGIQGYCMKQFVTLED